MTTRQNTFWRGEIPLFERTLQFEQGFGRVHILLAKAYSDEGRFEDAVKEDYKALAIMQNYLERIQDKKVEMFYLNFIREIHKHLGYCLDILGDLTGSLAHYKKALEWDPENIILQYTVGITYIKNNDFHSALSHLEKTVELDGKNLMAKNSLALCYQGIGEYGKAEILLREIVEKDSQSVSAKQNLESFLKKQQEF